MDKEKKLYMCFFDLEKAFDRVPRKELEWAMRKRGKLVQFIFREISQAVSFIIFLDLKLERSNSRVAKIDSRLDS